MYLIVEENRKLKMIMDGKVRCMVVTVLSKRIGSRGNKGGGLYLVEIRRPDALSLLKKNGENMMFPRRHTVFDNEDFIRVTKPILL